MVSAGSVISIIHGHGNHDGQEGGGGDLIQLEAHIRVQFSVLALMGCTRRMLSHSENHVAL